MRNTQHMEGEAVDALGGRVRLGRCLTTVHDCISTGLYFDSFFLNLY